MKKTQFKVQDPNTYQVALSLDTGCIVILMNGKVKGSLLREQSVKFAESVRNWIPETLKEMPSKPPPALSVVK